MRGAAACPPGPYRLWRTAARPGREPAQGRAREGKARLRTADDGAHLCRRGRSYRPSAAGGPAGAMTSRARRRGTARVPEAVAAAAETEEVRGPATLERPWEEAWRRGGAVRTRRSGPQRPFWLPVAVGAPASTEPAVGEVRRPQPTGVSSPTDGAEWAPRSRGGCHLLAQRPWAWPSLPGPRGPPSGSQGCRADGQSPCWR